jgi:hypothetical protein
MEALDEAAKEFDRSAEMMEWIALARDTLNNTSPGRDRAGGRSSSIVG